MCHHSTSFEVYCTSCVVVPHLRYIGTHVSYVWDLCPLLLTSTFQPILQFIHFSGNQSQLLWTKFPGHFYFPTPKLGCCCFYLFLCLEPSLVVCRYLLYSMFLVTSPKRTWSCMFFSLSRRNNVLSLLHKGRFVQNKSFQLFSIFYFCDIVSVSQLNMNSQIIMI